MEFCNLNLSLPIEVFDAGLFVSNGKGRHVDRLSYPVFDLIFVRTGELGIQEEDRQFTVKAGESLLLWPNRHHFGTTTYPPDLSFYWIHFLPDPEYRGAGRWLMEIPQHVTVANPEAVVELFRMFKDSHEAGTREPVTANLLMMLILAEVGRSLGAPPVAETSTLGDRATAYIRRHFMEPIAASDVATALGCNPNYLARVFRAAFGRTLTEEIIDRRLRYARRLLLEDLHNVNEISRSSGFASDIYFRRLFKREFGMTPVAFRRQYARDHGEVLPGHRLRLNDVSTSKGAESRDD